MEVSSQGQVRGVDGLTAESAEAERSGSQQRPQCQQAEKNDRTAAGRVNERAGQRGARAAAFSDEQVCANKLDTGAEMHGRFGLH